jgi:hypothetical protein
MEPTVPGRLACKSIDPGVLRSPRIAVPVTRIFRENRNLDVSLQRSILDRMGRFHACE